MRMAGMEKEKGKGAVQPKGSEERRCHLAAGQKGSLGQ